MGKVVQEPKRPTRPELIQVSVHSMKQLRVLLLPPEWDASPPHGYPQQYVAGTHFIHLVGDRQYGAKFLV